MSMIPATSKAFAAWLETHKSEMDDELYRAGTYLRLAIQAIDLNKNNSDALAIAKRDLARFLGEFAEAWEARKPKA